jgi:hypothetical protein
MKLIQSLRNQRPEIEKCMQATPKSVVWSGTDWSCKDPRFVDIFQTDKKGKCPPEMLIRTGLSAISLADEYTEWERDTKLRSGGKSRVEKLLENLNSGNRSSFYKEFVSARQFKDEDNARKYVRSGVQLRVFMGLYSSLLDVDTEALDTEALDTEALDTEALDTEALDTEALDTEALDTEALDTEALDVDTEALGMAGILSLKFWDLLRIKYSYMPLLARLLRSEWGAYARTKGTWMKSCSQLFNGINPYHGKLPTDTDTSLS